jgi:hypothetical protein
MDRLVIDGSGIGAAPVDHFVVKPGESVGAVLDRMGATARVQRVPDPPRKLSPRAAEFIRSYQREEAGAVLAIFWRYHSLEAEEFDTAEEAERFLDDGEEYGSLAGEAVVVGDEVRVRD